MVLILNTRTLKSIQRYVDGIHVKEFKKYKRYKKLSSLIDDDNKKLQLNLHCTYQYIIDIFAFFGHLSLIRYYYKKNTNLWSWNILYSASFNGYLHIIKWYRKNKKKFIYMGYVLESLGIAMEYATMNGHLHIMRYLYKYYKNQDHINNLTEIASKYDHLEAIIWLSKKTRWLGDKGFTTKTIQLAIDNGHIDIVDWLNENRERLGI